MLAGHPPVRHREARSWIVRWRSTIALPSWNADRALAWLVVARLEAAIARTLQRIGPVSAADGRRRGGRFRCSIRSGDLDCWRVAHIVKEGNVGQGIVLRSNCLDLSGLCGRAGFG